MNDYWGLLGIMGFYHLICAVSWRIERGELLDKLMSRNYQDYQYSKNIEKAFEPPKSLAQGIKDEQELAEDLAPIEAFGMN